MGNLKVAVILISLMSLASMGLTIWLIIEVIKWLQRN